MKKPLKYNETSFKSLKIAASALLFLAVLGYGVYEARNLIAGPQLSIFSPTDGDMTPFEITDIQGQAHNISFISLNGREIFIDEEGFFSEKVALSPGYNPITIYARDKFGREREKKLELVYEDVDGINVSRLILDENTRHD